MPLFVGRPGSVPVLRRASVPFAMAEDVAGAAFLFAADWGHLLEILVGENGGPRPVEPGEALSTTVALETVGVTILKNWA